jgi:cellulose synthase/poly-beta-1,6-N-acetylglucosamine synthase-like glycosyltransferase
MGVRREAFFKVGEYRGMQVGEDIDLSMRLQKAGYQTALIDDAFVYHRRKATLYKFYKQLYFHGKGRIDLHLKHSDALKLVHLLPGFFVIYLITGLAMAAFSKSLFILFLISVAIYIFAVFTEASIGNRNLWVGILSIITTFEMLIAYGFGLWRNIILRIALRKGGDSKKELLLKE